MSWLATFGETMGLCVSRGGGPLRYGTALGLGFGGAESNVAIGLSRLGVTTSWFGRVGRDEIGQLILKTLRGEGVDVDRVTVDEQLPTGLMLKWTPRPGHTRVLYYRRCSAGSSLRPEHLALDVIRNATALHVTGITAALGLGARQAVFAAIEEARAAGTIVCFDPNYRSQLWSLDEARPVLRDLAGRADIVFAGRDEAALLTALDKPSDAAQALADKGPGTVIVKLDGHGAVAVVDGALLTVPGKPVPVVDPVGAGDGFAVGFLSGLHDRLPAQEAIERGLATAAVAVSSHGDWEGLPERWQLDIDPVTDLVER